MKLREPEIKHPLEEAGLGTPRERTLGDGRVVEGVDIDTQCIVYITSGGFKLDHIWSGLRLAGHTNAQALVRLAEQLPDLDGYNSPIGVVAALEEQYPLIEFFQQLGPRQDYTEVKLSPFKGKVAYLARHGGEHVTDFYSLAIGKVIKGKKPPYTVALRSVAGFYQVDHIPTGWMLYRSHKLAPARYIAKELTERYNSMLDTGYHDVIVRSIPQAFQQYCHEHYLTEAREIPPYEGP